MSLHLIKNDCPESIALYKIARAVYAETYGASLAAVEALCAMISNLCLKTMRPLADVAADETVFECLRKESERHAALFIKSDRREFQMCLRVVKRMAHGYLPDSVSGATRFHRAEHLPDWAVASGYVAEAGDLFFYE
jgi:hypothetical protein